MGSSLSGMWQEPPEGAAKDAQAESGKDVAKTETDQGRQDNSSDVVPVSVFQGAQNVHIAGGTFNVAGRDIINVVNNHYWTVPQDEQLTSKIQDWLAPNINYRTIQIDTFSKRTPTTGSWFLESKQFKEWLERKGGILWGTGIPGAGKTILASTIIDHLLILEEKSEQGEISVAFAYCRYTDPIPVRDILAALVRQILERNPGLVELVRPLYDKHQRERTQPTQAELVKLLMEISQCFKTNFYILDGLDEAPNDAQFDLIEILSSLKANFILTSRPLKSLETELPGAEFFQIVAQEGDIYAHVTQKVDRDPDFRRLLERNNLKQEVVSRICENANGMFLHASLQLEVLQECVTVEEIRETLDAFPAKIEDLYAATMKRIEKQPSRRASLAKRIFLWLIFAQRSLTIEDLQFALAASLDTHSFNRERTVDDLFLVSVCCGLVTIDKESKLVRLIHFTAKDALQPLLLKEFPNPHNLLASTCISRLISCRFPDSEIREPSELNNAFKDEPFLRYAYDTWHIHVKKAGHRPPAYDVIVQFMRQCTTFPIIFDFRAVDTIDHLDSQHMAAYYNLPEFLSRNADCNEPTPTHLLTPLMLASLPHDDVLQPGSSESAMLLLEYPEIEVNLVSRRGWTALMRASMAGFEDVVGRLLQFPGIEVNKADKGEWTALMHASHRRHDGVVKRLLEYPGIDVNWDEENGCTALTIASTDDNAALVRLLLTHPEIEDVPDENGRTAFFQAAFNGYDKVTKEFIGHPRMDINCPDIYGETPLMFVAWNGHEDVAKQLLEFSGILVNEVTSDGWTALMYAAKAGRSGIVEQLLRVPDIQVGVANNDGETALALALENGHEEVAQRIRSHQPVDDQ